jgi:hypothetical protein
VGPGQDGYTPLHLTAMNGHAEVVEKLLEADAAVDATDKVCAPIVGEGGRSGVEEELRCCSVPA